jgi:hypothetical protein
MNKDREKQGGQTYEAIKQISSLLFHETSKPYNMAFTTLPVHSNHELETPHKEW